jgi:putative N-acetyltransferase (TIGR04045 family)
MIGLDGGPIVGVRPSPVGRWGAIGLVDRAGLAGTPRPAPTWSVDRAAGRDLAAYRRLRRTVFVDEQSLFDGHDEDDVDGDPATVVLVARDADGDVIGGVRVAPAAGDPALGWWAGSRLVVRPDHRRGLTVGAALVRAACAVVEGEGALRMDASVQPGARRFFEALGWVPVGATVAAGRPHVAMRWTVDRIQRLADTTKAPLAALLAGLTPGGPGWVGDDAAPVVGSDLLAACDAIMPSMVERDPAWAGWCGVLVNVNDLSAMGAEPVALLDAVAAPTAALAARVIAGLRAASEAWDVPVIGGHTQLGVPAALSVTALGRTATPVPGGGGRPGDDLRVTADLGGSWRPGYRGRQWDSTTTRTTDERRALGRVVAGLRPAAAKDVSMAGMIGTIGMLAEASGCGAEIDVAAVPRPAGTVAGEWLTCFPGFAMVTAHRPGSVTPTAATAPAAARPADSARCGRLVPGAGVTLVWPDGGRTVALAAGVTGLGPATPIPGS